MGKPARKNKTASLKFERAYMRAGYARIVGVDEAGRGPWAGPLVVGAVALPLDKPRDLRQVLRGVKDSKQMTIRQRDEIVAQIQEVALTWGIGEATPAEIGAHGLTTTTMWAVERALDDALARVPDFAIDYLFLDSMAWVARPDIPRLNIEKGDQLSLSIAAASVVAKVTRDRTMIEIDAQYPNYGFAQHKGYGTKAHRAALLAHGPCALHRMNYRPIRELPGLDSSK